MFPRFRVSIPNSASFRIFSTVDNMNIDRIILSPYENAFATHRFDCAIGHTILYHFVLDRCVFNFVEIGEQEQKHHTVQTDPNHELFRVVAFSEQQLELMREDGHELNLCWK